MKKIILLLSMLAVSVVAANAQADRHSVEARDIKLTRTGDYVAVEFTLDAGKKAAKSGYNLVVTPTVRNGAAERELTPVVVRGRRAKVTALRHELAAKQRPYQQEPVYMENGKSIAYRATLPYEQWMKGGQLALNGTSIGCCSSTAAEIGPIADNILYYTPEVDIEVVKVAVAAPKRSTGDMLAEHYPFVAPAADLEKARIIPDGLFDYDMPLNLGKGTTAPRQNQIESFIDATRKGSISIYFRQGRRDIDRNYMTNSRLLVELISVVRTLAAAEDSKVTRIVIAGFASPEGSVQINDRLAWDRAVSVKSFLTANSNIDSDIINIYNGAVDWTGLREMVANSDMYQKQRIIDVIDNVPVWDSGRNVGRLGELMRLDGGEPYRYMLREFFPKLRQAAYIKVYYENE